MKLLKIRITIYFDIFYVPKHKKKHSIQYEQNGQQTHVLFFINAQQQNNQRQQICICFMNNPYVPFLVNQYIPGQPLVNYDSIRKQLVHVYQNVPLQTSNFQKEVASYLNRKQSYSGNVVTVSKIKDQHISYKLGSPAMQISVVTDYIPWRLHTATSNLTLQQALFLLDGACKGFRQLLHRVRSPFIIQSYMVGVDGSENVKVWWNQYFYNNQFGFQMKTNIKLQLMVKSLLQVIGQKMQIGQEKSGLQKLLDGQMTFVKLQQRISQISKGLNYKEIGSTFINTNKDHSIVIQELKKIENNAPSRPIQESLRLSFGSLSSRKGYLSTERMILSPRKQERLEFNRKVITKRVYRDGTSPNMNYKLNMIKGDIQNLRSVANRNLNVSTVQSRLRGSKSVQAIVSVRKNLRGDTSIPQIKKLINEQEIVGSKEDLMVSRFVEPLPNPQNSCQWTMQRKGQVNPLYLSRLKKIIGQEKQINSTSRSINESPRFEQFMSSSSIKGKFGQSDRKIQYINSFQEL